MFLNRIPQSFAAATSDRRKGGPQRLIIFVVAIIGLLPLTVFLFNGNHKSHIQYRLSRFVPNTSALEGELLEHEVQQHQQSLEGLEQRVQVLEQLQQVGPGVLEEENPSSAHICPQGVPSVDVSLANTDLIRDCLDPDFVPWENFTYGITELQVTIEKHLERKDLIALVQIKDNQLTFIDRDDDCNNNCNGMLISLRDSLEAGHSARKIEFTGLYLCSKRVGSPAMLIWPWK